MNDTVIKVEDLTKIYKLYDKPSDRLKEALGFSHKKRYTDHYALQHVSLEVHKGETVGIIGTNGSGKSTILKILTGVLNPTSGSVAINGRISALLELGAGFNQEYTGIENVYLNGTMIGFSREEIDQRLDQILAFADIGEFINQPVKTYSSGMFVRLAFAIAINIDPEILIVDEALSVGDVFFQAKCYKKFEEFKKIGKTILFVSHDLSSINKYCDRVMLLDRGKKLAEGEPREMVDMFKKVLVNQLDAANEEKEGSTKGETEKSTRSWKSQMVCNPNVIEYGDKRAEITDFAVVDNSGHLSNQIEKEKQCAIKLKVQFHQIIHDPIIAFTIKDVHGTEITGTNTMYERVYIDITKQEEVKEVTFTQAMNLQGGEYLISFGCTGYENGEFTVYHRLYDVCVLTVISDKNTVGYYDLLSEIKVK